MITRISVILFALILGLSPGLAWSQSQTQKTSSVDGAHQTIGAKSDVASTDSTLTFSLMSFLKGLVKIYADVWDDGNNRLNVAIQNTPTVTANAGTGPFPNQQSNVTVDADTGGGSQTLTLFGIALPASGGAVIGGTATNPFIVNPGSGTFVVGDGSGPLTVDGTVTANAGTNLNTAALLTTSGHDAAFGTAGTPDSQVRSIQGIASMTPIQVQSNAVNLATEASLANVLTSANFAAAFGTAGSADSQVLSVQGIASMTPLQSTITNFPTTASPSALSTRCTNVAGDAFESCGGVQYTEGDVDATITGHAMMWKDVSDTLAAVSAAKPFPIQIISSLVSIPVSMTTQLGGEHVDPNEMLGYLRIVGGLARPTVAVTGVTTNTISGAFTLPSGVKTPIAKVEGTGSIELTLTLNGAYDLTPTNLIPLCTITLSGTTKKAKGCDGGAQITRDYPFYFVESASISGTGATGELTVYTGISGSESDASAANQTLMIASLQALDNIVSGSGVNVSQINGVTPLMGAGATGTGSLRTTEANDSQLSADIALIKADIATIKADAASIKAAAELIDNDQSGTGVHYRTSAGSTEDEHEVKNTGGRLFSITATNTNAAVRYLRCANLNAANTTPGSSTVFLGVAIPGNTTGAGITFQFAGSKGISFSTGLTCWLVTGAADTDVAEVAANEIKLVYAFD